MIKHIICDLGNVILMHDFRRTVDMLAKHCSATPDELFEDIRNSSVYRIFSKGLISRWDFYSELSYDLKLRISYNEFVKAWNATFRWANINMVELLETLCQKKYRLHLLSNIDEIHWEYVEKFWNGVFRLFDSHFLSFQMHLKKPNPAIYAQVLEELDVWAEECFFIDDLEENIDFASFVGIKGLVYNRDKHEDFVQKLNRKLNPA